jgi:hypothetical protein
MDTSEGLLVAARSAIERGALGEARRLFLDILELYPRTDEAEEAVRYLLSMPRRPPSPGTHQRADEKRLRHSG